MPSLREGQEALILAYRAEIGKLRGHLNRFESKGIRTGERQFGGRWIDVTDREIESLRTEIAGYERTIAGLEREIGDA